MKKVLVTGAAGAIGQKVLKYLLSEGKYEITALDLRTKKSYKALKKYRKRVNIIYGDINDHILIEALVKDQDFIIHLASIMPPFADIKKNLGYAVEYKGTENIIKAINYYNPNVYLVYVSSTTIYGNVKSAKVTSKLNIGELDYFAQTKRDVESIIKEKLANYTLVRLPLILTNPKNNAFMYNIKRNLIVESITDNDAAFLLVKLLEKKEKYLKCTLNASGGDATKDKYANILANVLNYYGLSFKYLISKFFVDKNFYSPFLEDTTSLEEDIEYRSESLTSYYLTIKRINKKRFLNRLLAKPIVFILRHKK